MALPVGEESCHQLITSRPWFSGAVYRTWLPAVRWRLPSDITSRLPVNSVYLCPPSPSTAGESGSEGLWFLKVLGRIPPESKSKRGHVVGPLPTPLGWLAALHQNFYNNWKNLTRLCQCLHRLLYSLPDQKSQCIPFCQIAPSEELAAPILQSTMLLVPCLCSLPCGLQIPAV